MIIGQRKAFYWQRIPEPQGVMKEFANRDIHLTSTNGNRKIMQSTKIRSRPPSTKRKCNQLSQF